MKGKGANLKESNLRNKLAVIIPAYNEEKNIVKCLKSLKNQTYKNFEIIVVNNNSTDKTADIARKFADKVYNCPIQGFVPTRNFGAKRAKTELISFLDADSYVDKTWVEEIIRTFDNNPSLVGLTGRGCYIEKNKTKRILYNTFQFFCDLVIRIMNSMDHYYLTANNMAIKRKIFLNLGGFDNFIIEDKWFSIKLRENKDNKCIFDKNMKVHYSGRRFHKCGFLKTIIGWGVAHLRKKSLTKYDKVQIIKRDS